MGVGEKLMQWFIGAAEKHREGVSQMNAEQRSRARRDWGKVG